MSGHVLQFSPKSRAYVPRGSDGKFAPKVLAQRSAVPQQPQLQVLPASASGPVKVLLQQQGRKG